MATTSKRQMGKKQKSAPLVVVEISDDRMQLSEMFLDKESKYIECGRREEVACTSDEWNECTKAIKKFAKKDARFIITMDPRYAATVRGTVAIIREKPEEPLKKTELENIIAQGIWKMYDRERTRVASRLEVPELDLLLADAEIEQIRIDEHKIANPLEFPARVVEFQFCHTFLQPQWFTRLEEVMTQDCIARIIESTAVFSNLAARLSGNKKFLFANIGENQTHLFYSDVRSTNRIDTIGWGGKNITESLQHTFALDEATAHEVQQRVLAGRGSAQFLREAEKVILSEMSMFGNSLEVFLPKYATKKVFIHTSEDTPNLIEQSSFTYHLPGRPKIIRITPEILTDKGGFTIKYQKSQNMFNMFSALATLAEFNFAENDDTINKIAGRHIRWLRTER